MRFHLRLAQWSQIDWERLSVHLFAALLVAVGTVYSSHPDAGWSAFLPALRAWLAGSLIYTGGYIQNSERKEAPAAPDKNV